MRPAPIVAACIGAAGAMLGACADSAPAQCPSGGELEVSETLYFGAAKPGGGAVTREEWDRFVGEVVTPRFPGGFTQWDASGRWKAADGAVVHEATHVLAIVHPPGPQSEANVRAIASEYKSRFHQEAVLRVRSPACAWF